MNFVEDFSEQGSLEWKVARIPHVTASDMHKVMAKGKGVTRKNYMVRKLCEILSGVPTPTFRGSYMVEGNEREETARQTYEKITHTKVKQRGFCYLKDEKIGASIDGDVINTEGLIEAKNLVATEMIDLLTSKQICSEHMKQMQTQLHVMESQGKKWVDYVALSLGSDEHGELPDEYKFFIKRVYRDEEMIKEIKAETAKFHQDLEELKLKLEKSIKEK